MSRRVKKVIAATIVIQLSTKRRYMLRWKHDTRYSQPADWVFPSVRLKGKQPRVANMLGRLSPACGSEGWYSFITPRPRREIGGR